MATQPPNNCHDQAVFEVCTATTPWSGYEYPVGAIITWYWSPTNMFQGLQCNGQMCTQNDIGQPFDLSVWHVGGPGSASAALNGVIGKLTAINQPNNRPAPSSIFPGVCTPLTGNAIIACRCDEYFNNNNSCIGVPGGILSTSYPVTIGGTPAQPGDVFMHPSGPISGGGWGEFIVDVLQNPLGPCVAPYANAAVLALGCDFTIATCLTTPPLASWDCVSGTCYDPGTGNGTYSTLAACQSACITPPPVPVTSCINPLTGAPWQIGETGPGGGIIFSTPGQGLNNTNFYFEVGTVDISTTQRSQACSFQVCGGDCKSDTNAIPGAEFGVYKEFIAPGDNGSKIGDGLNNTIHLNSYPITFGLTTPNPTNPVLDIHDLAAKLCADVIGPNGDTDWFLPSLDEAIELTLNLGPTSTFNNIANLSTSTSDPASAFYWTSSVLTGPGFPSVFDGIAAGFNANVGGSSQIMDRCTTGSVRPVRMFECYDAPPITPIDYNYRFDNFAKMPCIGGCWMHGYDAVMPGLAEKVIGREHLVLYLNKFDVRLNRSAPIINGNLGITSPNNPITAPINWHGPPANPSLPPNPYKITIYDLNEQLVGSWTYNNIDQISSCSILTDCYTKIVLSNPTPDPGTPLTFDLDNLVYPLPNNIVGFQTPCTFGQPGGYPYYVLIENIATQEIMTSPLGNGVGNTANLTNYAGTGNNMRFINSSGASISPLKDFYYNNACCFDAECWFVRWFAELPPTHPSFSINCDGFSLHPWYNPVLYENCAATFCVPSGVSLKLIDPMSLTCKGEKIDYDVIPTVDISVETYNELRAAGAEIEIITASPEVDTPDVDTPDTTY